MKVALALFLLVTAVVAKGKLNNEKSIKNVFIIRG